MANTMRRKFGAGLMFGLRVVWPIVSLLLAAIVALGVVAGFREGWSIGESIYFAFVTALTIGYGDLAPKSFVARLIAVLIGVCGVLLTAMIAAVAVKALTAIREEADE
jgi:hypothetical protein